MYSPIAICSNPLCNAYFPSKHIGIGNNVENVWIEDCSETCPNCGGKAFVPTGMYSVLENKLQSLIRSKTDHEKLLAIQRMIAFDLSNDVPPHEILRKAENAEPMHKPLWDVLKNRSARDMKAGLCFIFGTLFSVSINIVSNYIYDNHLPGQITGPSGMHKKLESFNKSGETTYRPGQRKPDPLPDKRHDKPIPDRLTL